MMKKLVAVALIAITGIIAANAVNAERPHNQLAGSMLVYPNQVPHAHIQTVQASGFRGYCNIFGYWHPVDWNNNVYGVDNSGNIINEIVGSVTWKYGNTWSFYWNADGLYYDVFCQ